MSLKSPDGSGKTSSSCPACSPSRPYLALSPSFLSVVQPLGHFAVLKLFPALCLLPRHPDLPPSPCLPPSHTLGLGVAFLAFRSQPKSDLSFTSQPKRGSRGDPAISFLAVLTVMNGSGIILTMSLLRGCPCHSSVSSMRTEARALFPIPAYLVPSTASATQ